MATPAIDFSKYEAQAPAPANGTAPQIDFSKYAAPATQSGPSDDWLKSHYAKYGDTSIDQARDRYSKRDFWDKAEDVIQAPADYFVNHTLNAIDAAKSGQYSKAANEGIKAGTVLAAPMLPEAITAAPLATAVGMGTGFVGGKVAQAGAKALGATDDQAELAGNVGGLASGMTGGKLADVATKIAPSIFNASKGIIDPADMVGLVSPTAANHLRFFGKVSKVLDKINASTDTAGLSAIVKSHQEQIGSLEELLNDALSKANALPPEGPTAKAIDVPDLRVQPAQPAPQNLLEARKAAFQRAQAQAQGGTFQVTPPEGTQSGPSAVIRNVQGQPVNTPQVAPNAEPTVLKTTGQPQPASAASNTPNGALYNEPIPEQSAQDIYRAKFLQQSQPKPTLIDQLKQWDNIRQIHSQLEDQIGKGQDELQSWMDEHNQEAPGAKPTGAAATAKARFDAARAAAESKANAIETDAPQGGHAGNGVSSVEELSRPGKNYVVTKSGALTYQGKSFAPESTPNGASHVTVLPDGSFRVNAGPQLNPSQTAALKASQPRVPTSDEDVESLLMKSIQNAQAKRSAKASD